MKKMGKKIISLLLAAIIIFGSVAAGVAEIDFADIFFSTAEAATYSGSCGDNLTWNLDASTGNLTISGTGKMEDYDLNYRPWKNIKAVIKTVTISNGVTSIGNYAFCMCAGLTSITIPDSVTSIGERAFYECNRLVSIEIPDSVTSIGDWVLKDCTSLTSITVNPANTVYSSDEYGVLFNKNKTELIQYPIGNTRTSYVIPDSVTSIGGYAFDCCASLVSIEIPSSVTSIGECAFYECTSLASITVSPANTVYSSDEYGVLFNKNKTELIQYSIGNIRTSYVIPDSVTSIGDYAFFYGSNLRTIMFGENSQLTNIGEYALSYCYYLRSITIPNSVTSIGDSAFYYCSRLKDIDFGKNSQLTSIGENAFNNCQTLPSITIPDSVASIGEDAFYECTSLTSIEIPDSVTSIGGQAFYECTSLASIEIPSNLTSIESGTFWHCSSLTSIEIPNSVTSIGGYAFYNCSSLEYVHIPMSVTTMIGHAILGNTTAYICSTTEDCYAKTYADENGIEFRVCEGHGENDKIVSGQCGDNLYWTLNLTTGKMNITGTGAMWDWEDVTYVPWDSYRSYIETVSIANGVTSTGCFSFYNCKRITSIEIPDSLTRIGDFTFYLCVALSNIEIPDSLTRIGQYAFSGCDSLTSIEIPDSVKFIDAFAFRSCRYLTNIKIPDNITSIEMGLLYECFSLESIEIPDTVTKIEQYAFAYCDSLTSIEIPDSVTTIGSEAFGRCTSLEYVHIPTSVTTIGTNILYNTSAYICSTTEDCYAKTYADANGIEFKLCVGHDENDKTVSGRCGDNLYWTLNLTTGNMVITGTGAMWNWNRVSSIPWYSNLSSIKTVTIQNGATSIGDYAFLSCENITSIKISESVTSIGYYSFGHCYSLTNTEIPESVTSIGNNAFYYCSSLTNVTIPDSVTSVGEYAFFRCSNLASVVFEENSPITNIADSMFSGCTSLTSIEIPVGVTSIGDSAFHECTNLASIEIPESVTSIGECAFHSCTSLTSIELPAGITSIVEGVFYSCNSLTSVEIPSSVKSIDNSAFAYCTSLTSVSFGVNSQLTNIGDDAFYHCEGLTSIEIPDNVTSIGNFAFSDCEKITNIEIPSGVTNIGNRAFFDCTSLASVLFCENSQLTNLGVYAFAYCTSLINIKFPSSLANIFDGTFYNCTSLASVSFDESSQLTSIGEEAFYNCTNLTSVVFGKNSQLTSIGDSAFAYCSSLAGIEIPSGVTNIGNSAFFECNSLANVTFEKNSQLKSIGSCSFWNCNTFTSIELPSGVTTIGSEAFGRCTSLEYVHIPTSVTSIGSYILDSTTYICSTTEDCYAKTYADENGIEFRVCTGHGDEPVHTHSYTEYRTEPTCQSFGYIFYLCSCGDHYMELLPKVDHSWKLVSTVEATCTEPGYEVYECQFEGCGETKTVEIGPKNHNFPANNAEYVEPTCTEDGYWILRCVACGEEQIKVNPGSKTGHDFGDGEIVKAPSCNEGGIIRYTCSCGYSYDEGVDPAHNAMNNGEVTTKPTCTEPGVMTYTCSECGEGYTEEIPALGHTLSYKDNGNGTHTVSCSECRYKEDENHTLKGRKCICGYTDTSVISVLLIQDNAPWLTKSNEKVLAALEEENYIDSWEICRTSELSEVELSGYSIVMFANDQGQNAYNNLKKNSEAINAYVEDGGVLIAGACDDGWIDGFLDNSSLPGGLTKSFVLDYNNKIADSDHPIVTGELTDNRELYNNDLYHNYCSHTSFSNIPENANVILTDTNGKATLLEYQYGNGYVIASGLTWEHNMEYHAYSTYYAEKAYEDVIAYAASIAGPADNRYVVRFVDWDGDVLKRERVAYGEAATAPSAPEREGYEFKGWDKEFNAITAHTVVNAVYEIKQYTVTVEFDETKGFATGSGIYDFGSGAALEASAFSGYNFIGWYEGDVLLSTDELYIYAVPARDVTITASFAKDVPTLSGIRVNTMPAKTSYFVGEGFDRDGLTILATYSDGSTAVIENGFTCTPNVFTKIGTQTITVSYGGKTCTFEVEVADVVLESIEINSLPIKTEYIVGETLVTTGLTLLAKYSNGAEKIISSGFTCTPTALNTVGIQKITVTYGGKSCTFDVDVAKKEEAVLIKIEVYQLPDKTVYVVGDKLDTTGLKLRLIYSDGSSKIISNYAFDCTPTLLETEGTQTITLTYLGFTCTFDVKVLDDIYVEHIPVQNYTGSAIVPEIKVYSTATDIRLTEGVDYTVSIRNNINIGTAYVTVTGKGDYESVVNTSFNIIGDVEISKVEIYTLPEKLVYNEGDTLDTDGLVLKVTYTDGSVYYVDSGFTCTPTVLNNAGKQIITVIYEGYVCSFEVTVNEKEVETINVYATYIVDGEVYTIYELEPGDVIPVPVNPEKDGWTFNGWTPEIPEKISYDDMTFIAVFTEGAPKFYVNEPLESYEYTGYPIMPAIDVYSTETNEILEEYVDYIINYSNNIDAGVAQVEIVGIGDYDGEVIFSTFNILARRADDITVSNIPATYETGSPICVVPIVKDGKLTLVNGVDFDLEYANNVNPGTATVTIIFKGNYSGTKTVTFEILEASERFRVIEMPEVIICFPQFPDVEDIIVCGENNKVLVEDEDYIIEYPEINGVGMAEIVVTGINDYEGEEFVIVVTVVATDISGIEVNYNETVVYTGNDIALDLDGKVICGNTVLVEGVDYAVEYVNNRNAGTMTVIIIGIGNYSGRIEFEVEIEKADISGMDVSEISDRYVYTGNEIKPEIVLGNLVLGRDYTVTYTNNVNIGTATVIIKGIGNYTGEIIITFVIIDASTTAPRVSVSIISDITSLGYEEKATLQTSVVWGDYNWGYLIWTSSNESVATVNSGGIVNALDEGTVTITVKLCDSNGDIIVDENGNEVTDSIRIECTMTFWQKIVRWFRNLFAVLAGIFR